MKVLKIEDLNRFDEATINKVSEVLSSTKSKREMAKAMKYIQKWSSVAQSESLVMLRLLLMMNMRSNKVTAADLEGHLPKVWREDQ